jgi:hypothetical protein
MIKIELKKDAQIPDGSGWCFTNKGYDESIIKNLNEGKAVMVDKIHPKAVDLINELKESDNGSSN